MSATRSGVIYSNPFLHMNKTPVCSCVVRTSTHCEKNRPTFFEPISLKKTRSIRSTRTQFSSETLKELCLESDNDSASSYDNNDAAKEEWTKYMPPKYEVNIDFDEASKAWRENKRRAGESWVYRKEKLNRKNTENRPESDALHIPKIVESRRSARFMNR